MNKISQLLLMLSLVNGEYSLDESIILNDRVNDCLLDLYLYMMSNDDDNLFTKFQNSYKELNEEEKEYVKKDYKRIIEIQEKNNKVKKKEK